VGVDKDDEILEHAAANADLNSIGVIAMTNGRLVMAGSSGLYIGESCCSALQCVAVHCSVCCSVCCSVLQCVAVRCSALQCSAL